MKSQTLTIRKTWGETFSILGDTFTSAATLYGKHFWKIFGMNAISISFFFAIMFLATLSMLFLNGAKWYSLLFLAVLLKTRFDAVTVYYCSQLVDGNGTSLKYGKAYQQSGQLYRSYLITVFASGFIIRIVPTFLMRYIEGASKYPIYQLILIAIASIAFISLAVRFALSSCIAIHRPDNDESSLGYSHALYTRYKKYIGILVLFTYMFSTVIDSIKFLFPDSMIGTLVGLVFPFLFHPFGILASIKAISTMEELKTEALTELESSFRY